MSELIIGVTGLAIIIAGLFYLYIKKKDYDYISFKESLDLTELPIITFYSNNNKFNFLLDTGCSTSVIDISSISSIKHRLLEDKFNIYGMEGNMQTVQSCEIELNYKNKKYKDTFRIMDMSDSFSLLKSESGVTVHGIIGTSFFNKYKYVLDFKDFIAYSKC